VESAVLFAALLAELDRGKRASDQVQVERQESRDDKGEHASQNVGSHHEVAHFVVERVGVTQGASDDWMTRRHHKQARY